MVTAKLGIFPALVVIVAALAFFRLEMTIEEEVERVRGTVYVCMYVCMHVCEYWWCM